MTFILDIHSEIKKRRSLSKDKTKRIYEEIQINNDSIKVQEKRYYNEGDEEDKEER